MKILQIIDKLDIGGAERVFVDMCNILQEHQQDVTALFLLEGGLLNEKLNSKITFLELNRLNKWSFIKLKECAEILKQYDVIHCHFRHVYRYIALVKKIFFIKSKIILHDHYGSIDIDKSVPFLFDSFLKPDYYIGVSKSLTEWAETKLKVAPENIFLLENIIIQHKSKQQLAERYDLILEQILLKPLEIINILFLREDLLQEQKMI